MSTPFTRAGLLRDREGEHAERVTFVELFFDLVFVFAITQLSHTLLEHLTLTGIAETAILLAAVWWVWMYTTWVTSWMNPETWSVRLLLISLMLLGLVLSTSIPTAFTDRALGFALAYIAMQLGRTLFTAWVYWPINRGSFTNLMRISLWFAASAPLWIIGALVPGDAQIWWWLAAIALELSGPALRYATPGLGASPVSSWNVSGAHMAERSGLFIIIALGESILVTGSAFSDGDLTDSSIAAFLAAFSGSILLWLLYFSHGADGGRQFIGRASDRGGIARLSYVYLHIPIVAGIVVVAVGDELVLEHPTGELEFATAMTVTGGPALYLLGLLLFKRSVGGPWLLSHLVGIGVLAAVFVAAIGTRSFDALLLTWAVNGALLAIMIVEEVGFRSRERREREGSGGRPTLEA